VELGLISFLTETSAKVISSVVAVCDRHNFIRKSHASGAHRAPLQGFSRDLLTRPDSSILLNEHAPNLHSKKSREDTLT
jgi:hypothetical protein